MAYWQRTEELVSLLEETGQDQAIRAAKSARLERKTIRRFKQSASERSGPLSIELVDKTAKRYALWTVRAKYDWGPLLPGSSESACRIHKDLIEGIYDIDVTHRRRVEAILLSANKRATSTASDLRPRIESRAGEVAAALDLRHSLDTGHTAWDEIAEHYEAVWNELDQLLTLAEADPT